jgi:hypothetical protein
MAPSPNPLQALAQLEALLGAQALGVPSEAREMLDAIRSGLRAWLDEPPDPLDDARNAIRRALYEAMSHYGPDTAAYTHALSEAGRCLERAAALKGQG